MEPHWLRLHSRKQHSKPYFWCSSQLMVLSVNPNLFFHRDKVVLRPDSSFVPKVNTLFHWAQEFLLLSYSPRRRPGTPGRALHFMPCLYTSQVPKQGKELPWPFSQGLKGIIQAAYWPLGGSLQRGSLHTPSKGQPHWLSLREQLCQLKFVDQKPRLPLG